MPRHDLVECGPDLHFVGDVDRVGVLAGGGGIEDRDARPNRGERGGDDTADAAGTTGDDGDLAVETELRKRIDGGY